MFFFIGIVVSVGLEFLAALGLIISTCIWGSFSWEEYWWLHTGGDIIMTRLAPAVLILSLLLQTMHFLARPNASPNN